MSFDTCINHVLGVEGGYVCDARDSGGETNWGITVATARAFGYHGAMKDLSRSGAAQIYKARYWDALRLDEVAELSVPLAAELFDSAVNCGTARAGEWLQRALNVLNQGGIWYGDLGVDGRVGAMTLAALREYLRRRPGNGVTVLLRALNALQGAHYIELAEARAKDEAYVFGWLLNRVA